MFHIASITRFLIFNTILWCMMETLPYFWKISYIWRAFVFGNICFHQTSASYGTPFDIIEFELLFQVTLYSHFELPEKGPRPKVSIYKHISDNSKKCLAVGNFGILSVCRASATYTSLCRGLKYLPKVRYIIPVDPLWARFLIFKTVFLALCLKNTSQT